MKWIWMNLWNTSGERSQVQKSTHYVMDYVYMKFRNEAIALEIWRVIAYGKWGHWLDVGQEGTFWVGEMSCILIGVFVTPIELYT